MDTTSVCIKCGAIKKSPFSGCPSPDCRHLPQSHYDRLTSVVLSGQVLSESALKQAQNAVQSGQTIKLSDTLKERAQSILDRRLALQLGDADSDSDATSGISDAVSAQVLKGIGFDLSKASLLRNPFAVLQVSPKDDRSMIIGKAADMELTLDSDICNKARAVLTQPKKRLEAEIRWFAHQGNEPRPTDAFSKYVAFVLMQTKQPSQNFPPKSVLNVVNSLEAALEASSVMTVTSLGANALGLLSEVWGQILATPEKVLAAINTHYRRDPKSGPDAAGPQSGFSPISDLAYFNEVLRDRQRELVDKMLGALNQLEPAGRAQVLTELLEQKDAAHRFSGPPGALIHGLVDKYELSVHRDLVAREENLTRLMEDIRSAGSALDDQLAKHVDLFANKLMDWDSYAQPVQLSYEIRGLKHEPSIVLAESVRAMSITLFNDYGHLQAAENLSFVLAQVFEEVPVVLRQAETDIDALTEIRQDKEIEEEERRKEQRERERFLTYRCDFGRIFKTSFIMTPTDLSIGPRFCVSHLDITGLRYGGKSNQGQTKYFITIETKKGNKTLRIVQKYIESAIRERLWKACGARLMMELLNVASGPGEIPILFGQLRLRDEGLVPCWGKKQLIPWHEIKCGLDNGTLTIERCVGGRAVSLYRNSILNAENSASVWGVLSAVKNTGASTLSEMV